MKLFVIACLVACAYAQAATDAETEGFVRTLPADILRDFPEDCFASTQCKTYKAGESWSLSPQFCGRSTCVQKMENNFPVLYEVVADCGPEPLNKEECPLANPIDNAAEFPACCPKYECPLGVTLQYPKPPANQGEQAAAAGQ